ncbi:MAG TPA: tRNA (N6-isopentenyl adenosine(37)-C2)-methylthiotransferase MiaB, partial [Myxococcales bacterium]|nr:tRNA (N6-isopentenyl adenosine(37)-C2)-methylthiotransferase MiaB [Myxococcales bacterium]
PLSFYWSISKQIPYLDLVFGPDNIAALPDLLERAREKGERVSETQMHKKKTGYTFMQAEPMNDGKPQAMVTVMKGCNKTCSYCIVPRVRGRELSKPATEVVSEVERLVANGVKEVMLLGQNVNSYGHDREDGVLFAHLLDKVDAIEGLERLRFTTSHPWDCTDELISRFDGRLPTLCEYFHLPVQSGSNRILEQMRRGYTTEEYLLQVDKLRKTCPDIHLSTDIIVGFPGENREDFEGIIELFKRVRFDSIFAFKYSPRSGTSAAKQTDDVSKAEKNSRLAEVFSISEPHRQEQMLKYQDQVVEVLVEGPSKQSRKDNAEAQLMGRTRTNVVVNFPVANAAVGAWRWTGKTAQIQVKRVLSHSLYGEVALVQ